MTFNSYDKSSKTPLDVTELEQAKFKKTPENKIAVRVGNEENNPMFVSIADNAIGLDIQEYDEALNVAKNVETLIASYAVPAGKVFNLDQIEVSGQNFAKYTIKLDANINKVKRTHYGNGLNKTFGYNGISIAAGVTLYVYTEHCSDGNGDFEATIEGRLNNV